MSKIYLVRHGRAETGPERCYYGKTDLELSPAGREQAHVTAAWLALRDVRPDIVFTSPLVRAKDTAAIIAEELGVRDCIVADDLSEIDLGEWEGKTFQEVQANFPEDYRMRGKYPGEYTTPGGESFRHVGKRFVGALRRIVASAESDYVVVAHAGAIRACACELGAWEYGNLFDLQVPTASVTVLDTRRSPAVVAVGRLPSQRLDEQSIRKLYARCETPSHVIDHMKAVAVCCGELLDSLDGGFDRERICKAALVHDVLRLEHGHAHKSAQVVRAAGFDEVADLVEVHHGEDFDETAPLSDADILWYADKLCQGSTRVTLEERFAKSRGKCKDGEALRHHQNRYRKALSIQRKLEEACAGRSSAAFLR